MSSRNFLNNCPKYTLLSSLILIVTTILPHHLSWGSPGFKLSVEDFKTIEVNPVDFLPGVSNGVNPPKKPGPNFPFTNALIVNGQEVTTSRYPYIISIQVKDWYSPKRYHMCAAVLVSLNTALTAAHCVEYFDYYSEYYAAVGFTKLSGSGGELIKVVKAIPHSGYNDTLVGMPHDIALIVLERNVTLSDSVQIAELTEAGQREWNDTQCEVAGWGYDEDWVYPDELMYTKLYWLTNYECRLYYRVFQTSGVIGYKHLCLSQWPNSACNGDSGGPVICDGKLSGIVSWASDCEGCFGIVASRVSSYHRWIENTINQFGHVA